MFQAFRLRLLGVVLYDRWENRGGSRFATSLHIERGKRNPDLLTLGVARKSYRSPFGKAIVSTYNGARDSIALWSGAVP